MEDGSAERDSHGVTAAVLTRDRGARVVGTLRSLLDSAYPRLEILLVDQSGDDRSAEAVLPFLTDPRLRYVRSASAGLARGRNLAISEARHERIGMTDDDCLVAADWIERLVDAFGQGDRVGVVFGSVVPSEHDRAAAFVPGYICPRAAVARSVADYALVNGIGACMGVRRAAWRVVGGFDEALGAGGRFRAADESDLALRVLVAGWHVLESPSLTVVHDGLRDHAAARELVGGYAYGTGAMVVKHLRCRTPRSRRLLARMAWRWARGRVHQAARFDAGPHRTLRLGAFVRGFAAGAGAPLDRRSRVYRVPVSNGCRR